MGSSEPVMWTLGVIGAIGIIELLIWLVVIIRDPGFDDLRPDLISSAPPATPGESSKSLTVRS